MQYADIINAKFPRKGEAAVYLGSYLLSFLRLLENPSNPHLYLKYFNCPGK
jgi:hypothetical protein